MKEEHQKVHQNSKSTFGVTTVTKADAPNADFFLSKMKKKTLLGTQVKHTNPGNFCKEKFKKKFAKKTNFRRFNFQKYFSKLL